MGAGLRESELWLGFRVGLRGFWGSGAKIHEGGKTLNPKP